MSSLLGNMLLPVNTLFYFFFKASCFSLTKISNIFASSITTMALIVIDPFFLKLSKSTIGYLSKKKGF